jgi:type II secretory pathway pseudopilin PulG
MKKKKIYEKGITLIALVITIIILLILAGVTLMLVFNSGIISKSQTAVDSYTEESAREKLSLALFNYKMGVITGDGNSLDYYVEEVGGILGDGDDNNYIVEIDGYEFTVDGETFEIEDSNEV